MSFVLRAVACLITAIATQFFAVWMAGGMLTWVLPEFLAALLAGLLSWVAAYYAARHVWRLVANGASGLFGAMLGSALIAGAIGLVGGVVATIIIDPHTAQGPLAGLFITGPAGFVLGAGFGALRWLGKGQPNRE